MSRLNLDGAAYQERSIIVNAQETINLFAEINGKSAPVPVSYYYTPGTTLQAVQADNQTKVRGMYTTTTGVVYVVIGSILYLLTDTFSLVFIGNLIDRPSQVIMSDNGLVLVIVDGSSVGYVVDLASNTFGVITDPSFYGGDYVVFLDTFFVFNRPNTNQFYISLSNADYVMLTGGTAFDPLDIAAKSGSADNITAITTVHKELWLIGLLTTEVWVGTGSADFYFQQVQGAYIQNGCMARFSVASKDSGSFWLMQNRQGKCIVVMTEGYGVKEISTPYWVQEFLNYTDASDAIGFCFQLSDHTFYVLTFPTANRTVMFDVSTGYSNRWTWYNLTDGTDNNRHRANCYTYGHGKCLIGDWENGRIYSLEPNIYTDNGNPIVRVKTFAHLVGPNYERVMYLDFDADMEPATASVEDDPADPQISLSWSDDRGKTYSNRVEQGLGAAGKYLTTISWNRLGMARDRVFKLDWSANVRTTLNGGFSTPKLLKS